MRSTSKNRGTGFLDAVVLTAVLATAAAVALPMLCADLDQELTAETHANMAALRQGIEAYFADTQSLPVSLNDLSVKPAGVAKWLGPYVSERFADQESAGLSRLADAWKQPLRFVAVSRWAASLRSIGANGIDEHGAGDDITESFDVNASAWKVTGAELLVLRAAITAYDQQVITPPLPHSWPAIVNILQQHQLLPGGVAWGQEYATDAWGNAYLPLGDPVSTVTSQGPP